MLTNFSCVSVLLCAAVRDLGAREPQHRAGQRDHVANVSPYCPLMYIVRLVTCLSLCTSCRYGQWVEVIRSTNAPTCVSARMYSIDVTMS